MVLAQPSWSSPFLNVRGLLMPCILGHSPGLLLPTYVFGRQ